MTANKSKFQPKDPRTFHVSFLDQEDTEEIHSIFPNSNIKKSSHGKRLMTDTEDLVHFLKTTSPEEFRRISTPEKSTNTILSKISRKAKRNTTNHHPIIPTSSISTGSVISNASSLPITHFSSLTAPTSFHGSDILYSSTIHRKNYIEIVPQKNFVSKSIIKSPSLETPSIPSFVLRTNNNKGGEPILPNKKRESSLHSGSIRYSTSIRSQLSSAGPIHDSNYYKSQRPLATDQNKHHTKRNFVSRDSIDTIETALLQRLDRLKLLNQEIPSDKIANNLAVEHIRALGITHILDDQYLEDNDKTKTRHIQVQTEDVVCSHGEKISVHPNEKYLSTSTLSSASSVEVHTPPSTPKCNQKSQEKTRNNFSRQDPELRAKRAEAALENALDQFELISGLAYKKLREIWEEKIRWENACMELRDRLLAIEQKQYSLQQRQDVQGGCFPKENNEQEDDELGLSEFPCSEK